MRGNTKNSSPSIEENCLAIVSKTSRLFSLERQGTNLETERFLDKEIVEMGRTVYVLREYLLDMISVRIGLGSIGSVLIF